MFFNRLKRAFETEARDMRNPNSLKLTLVALGLLLIFTLSTLISLAESRGKGFYPDKGFYPKEMKRGYYSNPGRYLVMAYDDSLTISKWRGDLSRAFDQIMKLEERNGRTVLKLPKFQKLSEPILSPSSEGFDSKNVYNVATAIEDGKVFMIYRAESKDETSKECTGRLGLAWSEDGIHFSKLSKPILYPEEDYERVGVEDPRLVKIGDKYLLTYTGYDGKVARLCLAIYKGEKLSDMLRTEEPWKLWEKRGPIFPDFKYVRAEGEASPVDRIEGWTKSGAILPVPLKEGPFKGKYIMFFGDTDIWMAYADDPTDPRSWRYIERPVITIRSDKFDNQLVEPGPPPIMTSKGILLLYNSAGKIEGTDYKGSRYVYRVGAVLLDKRDPRKVIARTDEPLMVPEYQWERWGYVNNVVFLESILEFNGKILGYYGAADRYVGLAILPW